MTGIVGFRKRNRAARHSAASSQKRWPEAAYDVEAQMSVIAKIDKMGEAFYAMSEDAYGDWLDALPQNEFIEFLSMMMELEERGRVQELAPA